MNPQAELITAHPVTWAYVSRRGDLGPDEIEALIGEAFCELGAAIGNAKIATHSAPRACYHSAASSTVCSTISPRRCCTLAMAV